MTGLIIALLILLFIALLLFIRVKLQIDQSGGNLRLRLKVLGIPFTLSPKKEKKIKLRDYSYRSMQKKKRKAEKAKLKAEEKEEKASKKTEKTSVTDKISGLFPLVKTIVGRFFRYLRVDVTKVHVNVATGDAASTAVLYGAVTQAVAALLDLTDKLPNVRTGYTPDVAVAADFLSEKTSADVDISFSIVVWQVLATLIRALIGYIKKQNKNK